MPLFRGPGRAHPHDPRLTPVAAVLAIGHACIVAQLTSNKAKEDAAVAWVMEVERAAGRQPRDTRYAGAPADVESPPRLIEIKSFGTSSRGDDLLMEARQVEEARRNPDNYYVYVVENVGQGDPAKFTLRVLGGARLRRLLTAPKSTGATASRGRWRIMTTARSASTAYSPRAKAYQA